MVGLFFMKKVLKKAVAVALLLGYWNFALVASSSAELPELPPAMIHDLITLKTAHVQQLHERCSNQVYENIKALITQTFDENPQNDDTASVYLKRIKIVLQTQLEQALHETHVINYDMHRLHYTFYTVLICMQLRVAPIMPVIPEEIKQREDNLLKDDLEGMILENMFGNTRRRCAQAADARQDITNIISIPTVANFQLMLTYFHAQTIGDKEMISRTSKKLQEMSIEKTLESIDSESSTRTGKNRKKKLRQKMGRVKTLKNRSESSSILDTFDQEESESKIHTEYDASTDSSAVATVAETASTPPLPAVPPLPQPESDDSKLSAVEEIPCPEAVRVDQPIESVVTEVTAMASLPKTEEPLEVPSIHQPQFNYNPNVAEFCPRGAMRQQVPQPDWYELDAIHTPYAAKMFEYSTEDEEADDRTEYEKAYASWVACDKEFQTWRQRVYYADQLINCLNSQPYTVITAQILSSRHRVDALEMCKKSEEQALQAYNKLFRFHP